VGINWEGLIEPDAGHFPVACGGVFSGGACGASAVAAGWMCGWSEVVERFDVREAQALEIREMQRTRAGDMSERVTANVAVVGSVGEFTDADAIEDDPDYAREVYNALPHLCLLSFLLVRPSRDCTPDAFTRHRCDHWATDRFSTKHTNRIFFQKTIRFLPNDRDRDYTTCHRR
jgi:hypothetical protein